MQTQNYVYYMHFLVLKESEQKCARALFVKKCERAGQNALIFILTSEMNSSCQITYKSTYNM